MTVDHLSRHLKRDVGANELELLLDEEIEAARPLPTRPAAFGTIGRLRMWSLWKDAGYTRPTRHLGRHRRRGRL
ncbi:hypothetical protein [Glycomyces paridis]|uniref:Uncharacterized protein n=1 Tax=Glycomyces paridis TaxID=2126555 RepID=A0A4S8P339_9ACTN|nr:hypothetical protein [Glycomyces paridis]THV24463.1 hypothetical protein E9998_20830 [Glycomyces paridis]